MTMPVFFDGGLVHQAELNLLSAGVNNLSTYLMGSPAPRATLPQFAGRQSVPQIIPNDTDTLLEWDAADSNTDNMWVSSVKSALTVQTAGSYEVGCRIVMTTVKKMYLYLLLNGTSRGANMVASDHVPVGPESSERHAHLTAYLPSLAVGSTIYAMMWHNTGGPTPTGDAGFPARFYAHRTGP